MAGRFSNLEFGDEQQSESAGHEQQLRSSFTRNFLAEAEEQYRWGKFEEALRLYTRALKEDRTTTRAWVGQVQMLVQLDECHEANVWSDKALELFRGNGELLAAKAQACARLQDHKTAIACSDGSLKAAGSSPWRWAARGEVLLAKGDKQHEGCFQKALLEPKADWFDRVVIAGVYMYYERVTNALVLLKEALELEPTAAYVWYQTGVCQQRLGLVAAAQTSFERCVELAPTYAPATTVLAELSRGRSMGDYLRGVWRRWSGQ